MFGAIGKVAGKALKRVGKGIVDNQKQKAIGQGISAFRGYQEKKKATGQLNKPGQISTGPAIGGLQASMLKKKPAFNQDFSSPDIGGHGGAY